LRRGGDMAAQFQKIKDSLEDQRIVSPARPWAAPIDEEAEPDERSRKA
jgi:hypothetical protein